ncbi:LysE family translocator [Marivita geojedonensis]|uniref:Transporter n=1 Tax=Marivita geojedonensis TaxID=1123756 RepID=A0A1X4NIM6_9RHOB|nr:LysE family transporter [Marivita geojedonensis]OSQ48587.1 transporter [Marivita geojedonensis]PRY75134.1 threonine/homoserine/homoserine lactone efflux protein [Marivita geojedonensis]
MSAAAILSIALIHLAAAMSPGPSFVVAARTAVSEGFGTATALAFSFGLGAALWAAAAMAGLALVFELMPQLFTALKVIGGAFLIFIAIQMWRHAREPLPEAADLHPRSAGSAVWFGFVTFAANPKTAVFFGAVFVGLVPSETPLAIRALLLAIIFTNETLWYILVARFFSLPHARTLYTRLKTAIDRMFGGLIALFGLRIAMF